ncbi:UNVERIFIED_CONTAM: putative pectinesterase 15 [Sesamum radiatum]|uniref:Pectinesterase n=1 Tax=Sesamum radiatum TaxID=300843 RepID=A0AAW2IZS4_SESRA
MERERKRVALRVSGDRAAFMNCRILSHQDTLLDDKGRHYYSNCYVEGDTDFIFGNGASIFRRDGGDNGAAEAEGGGGDGVHVCQLQDYRREECCGRPWGKYSVVFALTYMSNVVLPQGWDDWGDSSKRRYYYYPISNFFFISLYVNIRTLRRLN